MRQAKFLQRGCEVVTRFFISLWTLRWWYVLLFVILIVPGVVVSAQPSRPSAILSIPTESDWTDYGTIFKGGALGEWDYMLSGGFAGTALKKDGIYYVYYQGASGYQMDPVETSTWRAIGVATSPDGINFTKYSGNPVVAQFPNNRSDEGAVSGAVALSDGGEFLLYYGLNTAESGPGVYADGWLATSSDGLNFGASSVVLGHRDGSLWGSGDQLYPIIAFRDGDQWFVYYIPWGTPQHGQLGVARGSGPDQLSTSSGVVSGDSNVHALGMGGSARIGPNTYALFLNNIAERRTEVRTVSLSTPNQLSGPIETYRFDRVTEATVFLDEEAKTWFMYYRFWDDYGVKLAPAGERDTTPPTAPGSVTATPVSDRRVDLSWSPATDPDTGIVVYKVFRDGDHIATVKGWSYSDTGLVEQTAYRYRVSAVNYHGTEGPQSKLVTATTLGDTTPPRVVSVNALGPSNRVIVVFDEPVDEASAKIPANYVIDQSISVLSAALTSDATTVVLSTSGHRHHTTYLLKVGGVRDRAQSPNVIAPNTAVRYTYSRVPGLVGAWTFDEGAGETALDTSNYGNDGALTYTQPSGPARVNGRVGDALQLNGIDEHVTVDGTGSLRDVTSQSYTFSAWARPDCLPPNNTLNDRDYSILVRNYTGLYYGHTGRFRAEIRLASGEVVAVTSGVLAPGQWYHLAMVVDAANRHLRLYVDGKEVGGSPVVYSGSLAYHGHTPYYIGTSDALAGRYENRFRGAIDEAWIFDRALTQQEVLNVATGYPIAVLHLPVIMNRR
jgi:hypothetical protein